MPDSRQLRIDYLKDICTALAEYVENQGEIHIESEQRANDVLAISFTLDTGSEFHRLLRETMMRRLPE